MLFNNIRTKLWLTIVIVSVIFIILLGLLLSKVFENFYFNQASNTLINNGQQIAGLILKEQDPGEFTKEIELLSQFLHARIMVSDREGLVRACGGMGGMMHNGNRLTPSEIDEVLKGNIVVTRGEHPRFDATMLSVTVPIKKDSRILGAVLLYSPVESITEPLKAVRKLIYYVALGAVLVATVLSYFLAQWLARPLSKMNNVALAMAKGNFRQKVEVTSSDEIGVLGQTLNFLSEELQQNLDLLSQEKSQLGNILTSMTDGVVTFDSNGKILLVNPQAKALLKGINNLESGQTLAECCPFPEIKNIFTMVVREGEIQYEEIKTQRFVLAVRMAPLKQENGEIRGVVAVFQDVTKERKLEELRRDFVANVSHELRTPLSYLQGYTELLLDGMAKTKDEQNKYLNIILDESLRLKRLVNELLDLTQLQTGNLNLKKDTVNLAELVTKVIAKLNPIAEKRCVKLELQSNKEDNVVLGDADRLEQVLINLLDNALRYSPNNESIKIEVTEEEQFIRVGLTDKGQGIPNEELNLIWERFHRVDKARSRQHGGTGLGLAIVKNIIEAHHGKVGVVSCEGKSTTFWFKLPKRA